MRRLFERILHHPLSERFTVLDVIFQWFFWLLALVARTLDALQGKERR